MMVRQVTESSYVWAQTLACYVDMPQSQGYLFF